MTVMLNSRHKAGLFLTTVVAGLCLIMGETVRETMGAIIIGFALTWAFGSTNKMLRICIGAIGVLVFIAPFTVALIDHHNSVQTYKKSLDSFHTELPKFAKEHPDLSAGIIDFSSVGGVPAPPPGYGPVRVDSADDPLACIGTPVPDPYAAYGSSVSISRTLAVPNTGNTVVPCSMSGKEIAKLLRFYPEKNRAPSWYLEALDAGVSPNDIKQLTPPLDKPDAFDFKHAISDGAVIEVPSAILAILFFGSLVAEAKRFTGHSTKRVES